METKHMCSIVLCICWLCLYVKCDWIENRGLWYYISPPEELVDYHTAIAMCEAMNSRLAVLTNNNQNDIIKTAVPRGEPPRWIGLSNIKTTDHIGNDCADKDYFWNTDWYCSNDYTKYQNNYVPPETSSCMGVRIKYNGKWTAADCDKNQGYVCQWECKRLFIHFETFDEYSGIYLLDHYWNGHVAYVKSDTDKYIDIYKYDGSWVLTIYDDGEDEDADDEEEDEDDNYHDVEYYNHDDHNFYPDIATFKSNSYVPYGKVEIWKVNETLNINVGSFCIDCEVINLYVETHNNQRIVSNDMYLTWDISHFPVYADDTQSALIAYNKTSFTHCINIQIPGRDPREYKCDYIFPYPDKTVFIETDAGDSMYITNLCIPRYDDITTESTSISTTSVLNMSPATIFQKNATTLLPFEELTKIPGNTTGGFQAELEGQRDNKTIVIAVTVVGLLITIIIVIVVVSVFVVSRKRHINDTLQAGNHDIQGDPHIYVELDGSGSNRNVKAYQELEFNGGQYSYADLPGRDAKPVLDEDDITGKQQGTDSTTPAERYLAPDYGVLTENTTSHTDNVNRSEVLNAVYCEATSPNVSQTEANMNIPQNVEETLQKESPISQNSKLNIKYESEDDIQLHENDVYVQTLGTNLSKDTQENSVCYNETDTNDSRGIHIQDTNIHVTAPNEDNCEYYNFGGSMVEHDEDDLELFENSVYEETP